MEYLTNHLLEFSIILVFLILNVLYIIFNKTTKKHNIDFKDEYLIYTTVLEQVINNYKTLVLDEKVTNLRKNYDIDPQSKTNAIKIYQKEYNELLRQSSIEIMGKHLSKNTRDKLLEFYSEESLILHILNLLRS